MGLPLWVRLTTCLAAGLLSCACSTTNNSPPLPGFERIAVVTEGAAREDLKADSTAGKAAAGAAGGAAGGAATGAAIGLACGPLALFCVPVGVVVGGVTGAAAGGITQGGKGLSKAHSKQVNEVLDQLQADLDISDRLQLTLRDALPSQMQADPVQADALVTVKVRLLELRQHSDERVSLRLTADMHSVWDRDLPKSSDQTNHYEFETAREYVEDWLTNDGEGFRLGLEQCIQRVASSMARDLRGNGRL